MFAGGMTIAAPGILPESTADLSATDGLLTVSTTTLQGAAILEIVVNDPDYSATDMILQMDQLYLSWEAPMIWYKLQTVSGMLTLLISP